MELAEAAKKLKDAKLAYSDCQMARQQLIDNLKKLAEILENQEQYSRQLIFSIGEHKVQTGKGDVHFPEKSDIYKAFKNCQDLRQDLESIIEEFKQHGIDTNSLDIG